MKSGIHPEYVTTEVTCTCGSVFTTRSTAKSGKISSDVCSACHPFYTGKKGRVIEAGRLEKFRKKYAGVDYGQKAAKEETKENKDNKQDKKM